MQGLVHVCKVLTMVFFNFERMARLHGAGNPSMQRKPFPCDLDNDHPACMSAGYVRGGVGESENGPVVKHAHMDADALIDLSAGRQECLRRGARPIRTR